MTFNINDSKHWIAHIAKDFFPLWKNRLDLPDEKSIKSLGHNFYSVEFPTAPDKKALSHSIFSRYWFPVQYMWPTKLKEKGYIEKCAQGIAKKFTQNEFKNIIVFSLDRKENVLASNLRGRLLQILKENLISHSSEKYFHEWTKNPTLQPIHNKILIVAISDKCTWAGISTPAEAGCVFGGGRHYVGISDKNIASRAAAKLVEAIEFLKLQDVQIDKYKKWLELGAAPGGMTHELTQRNCEVWAVDKADLDVEILKNPLVHFHQIDVREFKSKVIFDAIYCDLNGPSRLAGQICSEKSGFLKENGLVIHTLKIHSIPEFEADFEYIVSEFQKKNCSLKAVRHLYNNKQEITLFFLKTIKK